MQQHRCQQGESPRFGSPDRLSGTNDCSFVDCHYMHNAMVEIKFLSQSAQIQIDSGAYKSVISSAMWKKLGSPKLKKYFGGSEAYDGHRMRVIGELEESFEWNNVLRVMCFLVIDSCKSFGLLGRDIIEKSQVHQIEQECTVDKSGQLS